MPIDPRSALLGSAMQVGRIGTPQPLQGSWVLGSEKEILSKRCSLPGRLQLGAPRCKHYLRASTLEE